MSIIPQSTKELAHSFDGWMEELDTCIQELMFGLRRWDLSDQPYMDWFNEGIDPNSAAIQTLENEGFGMDKLKELGVI